MREIAHRPDPVQLQGRGERPDGLEHLPMPDLPLERRIAAGPAP